MHSLHSPAAYIDNGLYLLILFSSQAGLQLLYMV